MEGERRESGQKERGWKNVRELKREMRMRKMKRKMKGGKERAR